jgi:hypothetical protein
MLGGYSMGAIMLRLIGYICLAFMAFQAYVVLYIRSHTDDQYGWKPSLCESAPFVRDVCRTAIELGVYFGVLPQDRAFMSETTDARDFVAQIKKQRLQAQQPQAPQQRPAPVSQPLSPSLLPSGRFLQ